MNRLRLSLSLVVGLLSLSVAQAQEGLPARVNGGNTIGVTAPATVAAKRPLKHYDYSLWQTIQVPLLSRDGMWAVYSIGPQEGDGVLVVRNTKTGAEQKLPRGRTPQLTPDSRFVVFAISPPFLESEKARKEKKPALPSALGILELATGKVETIEKVRRFTLAAEGSRWLAYQLERAPVAAPPAQTPPPPRDQQPPVQGGGRRQRPGGAGPASASGAAPAGADLVVYDLTMGKSVTLPDVTEFTWDKAGARLAYIVDSKDDTKDGLFVWEAGKISLVSAGPAERRSVTWDDDGKQLAFLRAPKVAKPEDTPQASVLWLWKLGEEKPKELITEKSEGVPVGWQLSETGLRFLKQGTRLVVNLAPKPAPKPKDPPETVSVDIWTHKDPLLQTMQKVRSAAEARRSYPALLTLKSGKLTVLSGPDQPAVLVGEEAKRWVLGRDDKPYQQLISWDRSYEDIYLVDLESGAKRKVLSKQGGAALLSPNEKYLFWWDQEKKLWLTQPVAGGRIVELGVKAGVPFWSEDDDHPAPPPPYGSAGWTEGDKSVLLYDKYDLWEANPENGELRLLTGGRKSGMSFRLLRTGLDPDQATLPTDKPILLSTTDENTKSEGFWQLSSLREGRASKILQESCSFGAPIKARNAPTVLFTRERFDQFPDLWQAPSLETLASAVQITDANPQQKEFIWGRSELITYTTSDGQKLPAVLTVPEDFDPNKKYPLMVYIYERMANQLHRYVRPNVGTSINVSRYVSNGYIVLRPDISYRAGYPGESALKCVLPAVQEVTRRGFIDEQRIGIQGHSWGAYQIAYLITRTNLFRAVEAGAAVADMVSAYGGIRYGTGMSRAFQYERDQSRMGGMPWTDPLKYLENSPIFWVDKVQTPYLTIHNDADGAVPWTQGIEFFTALRRLGKEAYLFNYNGEDHNLVSRENMKHWTVHMSEFFDHYLLGAPRPAWMDTGVPYTERGTRDLRPFYTRPEEKKL